MGEVRGAFVVQTVWAVGRYRYFGGIVEQQALGKIHGILINTRMPSLARDRKMCSFIFCHGNSAGDVYWVDLATWIGHYLFSKVYFGDFYLTAGFLIRYGPCIQIVSAII